VIVNTPPAFLHGYWPGVSCFYPCGQIGRFYNPAMQEAVSFNGEDIFFNGCPAFLTYCTDIQHIELRPDAAIRLAPVERATTIQEPPANDRNHPDRTERKLSAEFWRGQRSGSGRN
jgi:hypothetical protein